MAMISEFRQLFDQWIAAVSGAVDTMAGRVVRVRRILLDENADGSFTARAVPAAGAQAPPAFSFGFDNGKIQPPLTDDWKAAFRGGRVEVQLQSDHVMSRLLDFPSKANDFLDSMIRSQIDRLTPWGAGDAAFGWSPPVTVANDRIEVTFVATSKLKVGPLLQLGQVVNAASVEAHALVPTGDGSQARIRLLDEPLRSIMGSTVNMPFLLRAILISVGAAAAASLLINVYLGGSLRSDLEDLQRRISQRRTALRLDVNGAASGFGLLAKRKQATPSSVMVLEAVSRALPDSTYATELRIEGDKIQVIGMTEDAPSLIHLMEQSPQFSRATFFAPTTRAAGETGERFHIEAHITAYFGSGS
jgi:general secretion pathway protein L